MPNLSGISRTIIDPIFIRYSQPIDLPGGPMPISTVSVWQRLADGGPGRSPETPNGIWDVLRERLNPSLYRPVRSPKVAAVPLTTRHGQAYYILANRAYSKYLQLAPDDHHLWTLMDGTRSIKDLIFEYFTTFGALAFDKVAQLVFRLRFDHMLADPALNVFASVRRMLRRRGQSFIQSFWQVITGQRTFQIRRIDGIIDGLHRHGGWLLYTTPVQILYVGVCLVGGWLFLQHLASGRYDLFQSAGSYTKGLGLLFVLNYVSITIHETSHALTCKHYGAHVNGAGVMLYYGVPAYFVDTTDVWTKPSYARIATSWAGPYSGLILAGLSAIAVQVWPASAAAPMLHRLSFLMILSLLFNLVPLLELDGYFMLVDWLEIPMLRSRAVAFFRKELWQRLRRREALTGQERFLAWFGGLSVVFSILIIVSALLSWQYRLKTLTRTLWGGGLGSKALLVLLLLVLSLPLVMGLGSRAVSTARAAARWTRRSWHTPRARTLRQRETLLRAVHFLSPLSDADMVEVATRMHRQAFRAGEIVIRQGEEGDRFYVIEHGVAEVLVGDDPLPRRQLTRGDYFGEIALLERVNRTATVRAVSPVGVLWLGLGDFDRLLADRVSASAQIDEAIHTLEGLRQFSILADLSSRELDALASRLLRERFSAGAVVIQEGEPGDAFYLVESGQAEVLVGGHRRNILGRGTYFGEIALLHDVPRTATVRALTPLEVFKLGRQDFEALIVKTLDKVATVLEDVGHERLAAAGGSSMVYQPGKD
jgi:CRP-like cAMP-binding protein/Zn-dependent protease